MWDLVGDIGGTNLRLAALEQGQLTQRFERSSHDGPLEDAITAFSAQMGSAPARAVIAAAGPVRDGRVRLTNADLWVAEDRIGPLTRTGQAVVLNDFAAAAWSLVGIDPERLSQIRPGHALATGARLAIGPGTGLGVAGLVMAGGHPVVVPGEGGHVRIAPNSPRQWEIFTAYAARFPEFALDGGPALEAEAILSGLGLSNLFEAISSTRKDAASILQAAQTGAADAQEAAQIFAYGLGALAGDLSLLFNATGGVYLLGGVAARNPWLIQGAEFERGFTAGGRFTRMRESTPVWLVTSGAFGLEGCVACLLNSQSPS